MKINVTDKKDESLLNREIVYAVCDFDNATPSNPELRKRLAAQLGVKEELVVIKNIFTDFGAPTGKIEACVYKDEASLKRLEPKAVIKKNTPKKEEKKEGEAAPAEKKEEKPAEEKKEEKPAEEKKEEKPAEAAS